MEGSTWLAVKCHEQCDPGLAAFIPVSHIAASDSRVLARVNQLHKCVTAICELSSYNSRLVGFEHRQVLYSRFSDAKVSVVKSNSRVSSSSLVSEFWRRQIVKYETKLTKRQDYLLRSKREGTHMGARRAHHASRKVRNRRCRHPGYLGKVDRPRDFTPEAIPSSL